jgi:hypothetical protein
LDLYKRGGDDRIDVYMTSQIIIIFPRKPVVVKKPFFPVFSSDLDGREVNFSESRTDVDGVYCMKAKNFGGISLLIFHGITKGSGDVFDRTRLELEQMLEMARRLSMNRIPIHPDKWYAVIETHDFYKRCEFAHLFLSLFDDESIKNVQVIGWNFSDITEEVKMHGKKIQNVSDKTNPLINPDAILVFEIHPRSKRRVIAFEKPPKQYKRLVSPALNVKK